MVSAFMEAGVPAEAFGLYPGGHDAGGAIMTKTARSMIFGSAQTVAQHAGNPKVQAHGPGFSKILIGDDVVDDWEDYLDLMVESVLSNSGRSCINCSGIWASRHTREIATAIAERIGPVDVLPPSDPQAQLAAFTVPAMATGTYAMVEQDLAESGVTDMTAEYGEKLIEREHCAYLRPMVVHADSPDRQVAAKEYMFPFVSVVRVPASRNASSHRPHAGRHGADSRSGVRRRGRSLRRNRSTERRPDSDESIELVAAARRKHHRFPVPLASLPGRRHARRRRTLESVGVSPKTVASKG